MSTADAPATEAAVVRNTETGSGGAPRFFLLRLVPPRATFPDDMSAAENAAMAQHFAYWSEKARERTAVVYGPVRDSQAVWGLAVIEVADEESAREVVAADPIIRSGLGFSYDTLPMLNAVVRG